MNSKNPLRQSIISERIILGINLAFKTVFIFQLLTRERNSGDKEIIGDMVIGLVALYLLILVLSFYRSNVLHLRRAALAFKLFSLIPGLYLVPGVVILVQDLADLNAIQLFVIIGGVIWFFATLNHLILRNTHALR